MNNSPIDVLLQLPVPRVEPAPAGARARDESSAFDNHFRQASSPGATPPPAASRKSNDSSGDRSSQTPAASNDHSSQSQSKRLEPATASQPSATKPAADGRTTSIDTEHDEDAVADDSATAVAALAAAEQLAQSGPSDLAGDASDSPADETAAAPANSDNEQRPRAREAKSTARANRSVADSDAPAKSPLDQYADSDGQSDAAQAAAKARDANQQSTPATSEVEATAIAANTSQALTETTDAENASQAKTRRGEKSQEQLATGSSVVKHSDTQSAAAPANAIEKTVAVRKSAGESIGDAASRKSDKRTNTRSTATPTDAAAPPTDAAAPPTERPAFIAATADATFAPAISPSQLPAANVAATTSSATKPQDTQSASKPGFLSPFARLERGAQSARGANQADTADGPRHVDPARFVSRVARAIHTAQERGGPLQLRLSPPELGAMRLELSLSQGALTATIETENSTTRQLLLDNLPALRERLAEQNVKIERFDVDVRRDPSGNQQNTAPQDRGQTEHHDRRPGGRNSAQRTNSAAPSLEDAAPIRRTITSTSINVVA